MSGLIGLVLGALWFLVVYNREAEEFSGLDAVTLLVLGTCAWTLGPWTAVPLVICAFAAWRKVDLVDWLENLTIWSKT